MGNSRHVTLTRRFVITAVCSLVLVSCGNSSDAPPHPSAPPKSTTTTPPPAWESKFTAEELAIYREVILRAEAYESKAQPIWAAGKATRAAKALFEPVFLERMHHRVAEHCTEAHPSTWPAAGRHNRHVGQEPVAARRRAFAGDLSAVGDRTGRPEETPRLRVLDEVTGEILE